MQIDSITLLCVVNCILNNVVSYLLKPIGIPDHVPWQMEVLFLVFQVFAHERMFLEATVLLFDTLYKTVLLIENILRETILRFENVFSV